MFIFLEKWEKDIFGINFFNKKIQFFLKKDLQIQINML